MAPRDAGKATSDIANANPMPAAPETPARAPSPISATGLPPATFGYRRMIAVAAGSATAAATAAAAANTVAFVTESLP